MTVNVFSADNNNRIAFGQWDGKSNFNLYAVDDEGSTGDFTPVKIDGNSIQVFNSRGERIQAGIFEGVSKLVHLYDMDQKHVAYWVLE